MNQEISTLEIEKINLETARIPWLELQRFFAAGNAVFVANGLDLVEVAHEFAQDNKIQVKQWLDNGQVALVSDAQALEWYEQNAQVWAVVVKPWVLIQE